MYSHLYQKELVKSTEYNKFINYGIRTGMSTQVRCTWIRLHLSAAIGTRFPLPSKEMFRFEIKYMSISFTLPSLPVHVLLWALHHGLHLLQHLEEMKQTISPMNMFVLWATSARSFSITYSIWLNIFHTQLHFKLVLYMNTGSFWIWPGHLWLLIGPLVVLRRSDCEYGTSVVQRLPSSSFEPESEIFEHSGSRGTKGVQTCSVYTETDHHDQKVYKIKCSQQIQSMKSTQVLTSSLSVMSKPRSPISFSRVALSTCITT